MNPQHSRYYTYVKPIFRNQYTRTYFTLVLNIIVFVLIAVFAIHPKINEIVALKKQISSQQSVLSQVKQQSSTADQAVKNFTALDPTIKDKVSTLIPDKTNVVQVATNLVGLVNSKEASFSGVQFQPIDLIGQPDQLSRTPKLENISFTLSTGGGYPNLVSELNSIINLDRIVSVDSISFTQPEGSGLIMIVNAEAFVANNE